MVTCFITLQLLILCKTVAKIKALIIIRTCVYHTIRIIIHTVKAIYSLFNCCDSLLTSG